MVRKAKIWLRALFRKAKLERELEEELRYHLEQQVEQNHRLGMNAKEARLAALRSFGGVEQAKEQTRDLRGLRWLADLWQDLCYGARLLRKQPAFTGVVVLTLALGIGANTAIFGVINAALLRPLPAATEPDRLVAVARRDESGTPLAYPGFVTLREQNEVLAGIAAFTTVALSFGNGERSEVMLGALVSGNYFDVLGIRPLLGRTFLPEEDRTPGAHPVVILSHRFWESRCNSDAGVIGQAIVLNGQRFTVIGVAPAGFDGTNMPVKVGLWMPMMMYKQAMPGAPPDLLDNARLTRFDAIGRLKPGVRLERAQAALAVLNRQLEEANPVPADQRAGPNEGRALKFVRLQGIFGPLRSMAAMPSKLLAATVFAVLLIACANVANLLLARAATRRKEIAVRLALGATRLRLLRQLLTESLLLALLGGGAGLVMAYWFNQLLTTFRPPFPPPHTFSLDLPLDARALGFTLLLAVITGVVFGLLPALQASKSNVVPALKDESGAEGQRRWFNWRNALVVAQVALSLVLLVGAGLFIRSVQRAQSFDLGFKPDHVLAVTFDLRLQGYDEVRGKEFFRRVVERLVSLPDVQTVSMANFLPLGFMGRSMDIQPEGRDVPPRERPNVGYFAVGLHYFETLGTPLLRGRDFTPQDTADAPAVAIISEGLARRLWPNEEALGKRVRLGDLDDLLCEVVGIARDAKNSQFSPLNDSAPPSLYRPFAQDYAARASLVIRTKGNPIHLIPAVRREVAALDRNLPLHELHPLTENVGLALWSARTGAAVLSIFGALGVVLAAIGLYGVMSYAVARRTREIGVRMALGAQARDVLKLIVGQGLVLALIGAAIGLALAFAVTRWLASYLYGVSATDLVTFAGVSLFLLVVALLACYLPARRATKVDPLIALRYE